jgi:hypothetical protein
LILNLNYPPRDEYIESTTITLDATWSLYVLLAVQSVLTLLMFLFSTLLYHTPIGNGFGMVGIMSGIDKDSLNLLSGAAFSGDLEKPVKLNISFVRELHRKLAPARNEAEVFNWSIQSRP